MYADTKNLPEIRKWKNERHKLLKQIDIGLKHNNESTTVRILEKLIEAENKGANCFWKTFNKLKNKVTIDQGPSNIKNELGNTTTTKK